MQKKNTIKKSALAPTILVAGGAGFIGSHLAEVLLHKEARVIVLDDFRTGKEIHVKHLLNNPKFALYDVDINLGIPSEIESVDYIFHLAGLEEYLFSKEDIDLDSLLTNALGTKNLLDLAQKSNAKFVLASTIDVYEGVMSQLSLNSYFGENDIQEKKYTLAEAKRYAEALVWEYHKRNSTDVRIVRFPEVYGPRMNLESSGTLGKLMRDLIDGRHFILKGDGSKKDYYLYINDAVSGMVKALLEEKTAGKIYTLVPSQPVTNLEIAFLMRGLADRHVDIKFEDDKNLLLRKNAEPDTYNLRDLKWKAKTDFKNGVSTTLTWLGYQINEHSFKNAKLLEQKQPIIPDIKPAAVPKTTEAKKKNDDLFSLKDIKESSSVSAEKDVQADSPLQNQHIQQNYNSRQITETGDIPKIKPRRKISLKKPNLNIRIGLPVVSLVSKLSLVIVILFSFLLVFIAIPGYRAYSSAKQAMEELEAVPEYIGQFDSQTAALNANLAYEDFNKANKYFSSLSWLYTLFGKKDEFEATSKFMSSVSYFSKVAYDVSMSAEPFKSIWISIQPNSEATFDPASLDDSKLHISDAKNNLQLALADFNQIDQNSLPDNLRSNANTYENILEVTSEGLDLAWSITSDLPNLLGFEETKKYLILFQNNNELRPTGGFIGSYAFLYLNEGKIEELSIDDIYNPDGQIDVRNIRVTPPGPIGEFLLEDRLYIRNANWDPDFTRSAATIKDLFFRLNGEDIDGVLAIDLHVVKRILDVTGPMFLTAYNEEVTSQNLYERTQFHASFDYEEGSQQKRQFLTVLGSKLLETLFGLEQEKTAELLKVLSESLEQRHMQMYLFSSPINAAISERNWSGNLVSSEGDYLQVVNANLGGTKANYYVENDMEYKVTSKTRDGLLRGELVLNYNHTGVDESWPGGPYTNYVRVLAQNGAKLTGATITYDQTIQEDIFEKVIVSQVEPYASFETDFVLKPSSSVKLVLYYDLAPELSLSKENNTYTLFWQKQPGTHNDQFTYSLAVPFGMELVNASESVNFTEGIVHTFGKLNEDFKVFVDLQ
ncbi:NAD-dependent epimerase/dehydratase family protein [Patescibacteria group bacterium]